MYLPISLGGIVVIVLALWFLGVFLTTSEGLGGSWASQPMTGREGFRRTE